MKIFRVVAKVTPRPEHPLFWKIETAFLVAWVLAPDAETARTIAAPFPSIHLLDEVSAHRHVAEVDSEQREDMAADLAEARAIGFSWNLLYTGPGDDASELDALFAPEAFA